MYQSSAINEKWGRMEVGNEEEQMLSELLKEEAGTAEWFLEQKD